MAVLTKLDAIATALPGMQQVILGVPLSLGYQKMAYLTVGGQAVRDATFREYEVEARFVLTLVYGVEGQEEPAELWIAATVDALRAAVLADRTLGGACVDAHLEFTLTDTPEYEPFAAEEARRYPITVVTGHGEPM